MEVMPMRFVFTNHAIDRWRERCAAYADEKVDDIERAIAASERLEKPEVMRIIPTPNTIYFHHKLTDAVFVIQPLDEFVFRVITVITPYAEPVRQVPKRKVKAVPKADKPKEPSNAVIGRLILAQNSITDTLNAIKELRGERPKFSDINERREWVKAEIDRLKSRHAGTAIPAFKKVCTAMIEDLIKEMADIKEEWRVWNRAKNEADQQTICRADGGINYLPALKYLLAAVEQQERRIAELEALHGRMGS